MAHKVNVQKGDGLFHATVHPHLRQILAAIEGIELAVHAVPFWPDIMKFQDKPEAQNLLTHIHNMFMHIEESLMRQYSSTGVLEISLTQHEIRKAKLFAIQLQLRSNEDISKYFELLKVFLLNINKLHLIDILQWEDIIKKIQRWTSDQANKLSTERSPGSRGGDIRSNVSYYFEEVVSVAGSPIEYDPIYSTPPGTQPSEIMRIRMDKWQKSESSGSGLCSCESQRALTSRSTQHPDFTDALLKLLHTYIRLFSYDDQLPPKLPHPQSSFKCQFTILPTSSSQKFTDEANMLIKIIDSFLSRLIHKDDAVEIVNMSLSFVKELISCDFLKIAVPFLVTLLHGAVNLHSDRKKEAYKLLIDVLRKLKVNKTITPFEKWFLKIYHDFISRQQDSSDLPDIQTSVVSIMSDVIIHKSGELARNATEAICAKTYHTFEQMLKLYHSHEELVTTDAVARSTINFLESLEMIKCNKKADAAKLIMSSVWQNPDLCDAAAKAFTSLLPLDIFSMVNTTSMIPPDESDTELYCYERDIQSKVESGILTPTEAGLQYLDLMINPTLIQHSHQKVLCLLNAARYFVIELRNTNHDQPRQFALRNAVSMLAYDTSQLALRLHPGMRVFALTSTYHLTCAAAKISDPTEHSCLSGRVACSMLKNLVHNSKFTFLLSQPITRGNLRVVASSYINKVSDLAQKSYLKHLLNTQPPSVSRVARHSLLRYQWFETFIHKGEVNSVQFNKERLAAMSAFLKEVNCSFEDVSTAMKTPLLQRNSEGFIEPNPSLGDHLQIAELTGIIIDCSEESPSFVVVFKQAKNGNGLLSYKDITQILQLNPDESKTISFSLDPPSGTEIYHPFMKMRCHPAKLQNTEFMHSLFDADYLLKCLNTGLEVSAEYPFDFKPVQKSLTKNLPKELAFICRPPFVRGMSHMTSHRFWIEAEEIDYGENISQNKISYCIGSVRLSVKCRPLVTSLTGQSFDAKHNEEGPDAQFAQELTKHYETLSKHFPILARVKELSKLQFMIQRLHTQLQSLKKTSPSLFGFFNKQLDRLRSQHPIEHCPSSCTWVPATFGKIVYGGVLLNSKHCPWDYLGQPGADLPQIKPCKASFPEVFDLLLNDVNPVLDELGGICFNSKSRYSQDISDSMFGPDLVYVKLEHLLSMSRFEVVDATVHNLQAGPEALPVRDNTLFSQTMSPKGIPQTPKETSVDVDTESGVKFDTEQLSKPMSATSYQEDAQHSNVETFSSKLHGMNVQSPRATFKAESGSQPTNITASQGKQTEFQIDSFMENATRHQLAKGEPKDSLSITVRQSLINQAVLGNILEDKSLLAMLETSHNFNETNFHPNATARQQIKTALVMRKLVELHIKRGTEEHIISSQ